MAGRGTDIILGPGVKEAGGLFVLGTERHESRRIDDQLVGRSGRQGEPGESLFLISMEDEIMQLFGSEKIINAMEDYDIPEDEYVSGQSLSEAFKKAQDFVDSKNLDSRLYLYKYDSVTNFQREFVYELRDLLLQNEDNFLEFLKKTIRDVLREILSSADANLIAKQMREVFGVTTEPGEVANDLGLKNGKRGGFVDEWLNPFYQSPGSGEGLTEMEIKLGDYLEKVALKIKQQPEVYQAGQSLVLQIIDNQWSNQLELMDVLKEEANLFSYASEDPLIDYILESRKLFEHMQSEIRRQFLSAIFLRLKQQGEIN